MTDRTRRYQIIIEIIRWALFKRQFVAIYATATTDGGRSVAKRQIRLSSLWANDRITLKARVYNWDIRLSANSGQPMASQVCQLYSFRRIGDRCVVRTWEKNIKVLIPLASSEQLYSLIQISVQEQSVGNLFMKRHLLVVSFFRLDLCK